MPSFLETRPNVSAETLVGPRVYSTDLLPAFLDPHKPTESVQIAARALKIKIITRGLVTLNSVYLVSPLGVLLLKTHPDLFDGEAILPAFRTDKVDLNSLINVPEAEFVAVGVDRFQLDEHIAKLDESIRKAMPWELGNVAEKYRASLLRGVSDPSALINIELAAIGFSDTDREDFIKQLNVVDLTSSKNLRDYIASLSERPREVLSRYATACYHSIGAGVVRCEVGTDLNPLSEYKAADALLSSRPPSVSLLSDEAVFLSAFLDHALDAIQSALLPSQAIDAISFKDAHDFSAALREQGFQKRYEEVLQRCAEVIAIRHHEDAVEGLNADAIIDAVTVVSETFRKYLKNELSHYEPEEKRVASRELRHSGSRFLCGAAGTGLELATGIPFISTVISIGHTLADGSQAVQAGINVYRTRSTESALEQARSRRESEIRSRLGSLATSQDRKAKLLDAAAALEDIYHIRTRRA